VIAALFSITKSQQASHLYAASSHALNQRFLPAIQVASIGRCPQTPTNPTSAAAE
jgi:hypothetical protein